MEATVETAGEEHDGASRPLRCGLVCRAGRALDSLAVQQSVFEAKAERKFLNSGQLKPRAGFRVRCALKPRGVCYEWRVVFEMVHFVIVRQPRLNSYGNLCAFDQHGGAFGPHCTHQLGAC